eukprot:5103666-Alexandrium_andersonii.AAC.1
MHVHVLLENAGSMRDEQRCIIEEALQLREEGSRTPSPRTWRLDSAEWSPFPRRRYFFSSLAGDAPSMRPARRAGPWEEGWAPR